MRVLGVAGTAKNTGKTTATVALINQWPEPNRLAVTSIGYDGESRDNVTGLPKPRLHLPAGTVVATASRCIDAGSAQLKILEETSYSSPLGRLVLARVEKPGLVVLAGPSHQQVLKEFLVRFEGLGIKFVLVDGAFGRLSPMSVADGLILATGGARSQDIEKLAREAAAIEKLLALPLAPAEIKPSWQLDSLLVLAQVQELVLPTVRENLEISGVVDTQPLAMLIQRVPELKNLVFSDPVKLLLVTNILEIIDFLKSFAKGGGKVMVRANLPLLGITVNPFYPDYNEANRQFTPAWLDAELLRREVAAAATSTPVIDVVREGPEALAGLWQAEGKSREKGEV